jgi:hypothetical protein
MDNNKTISNKLGLEKWFGYESDIQRKRINSDQSHSRSEKHKQHHHYHHDDDSSLSSSFYSEKTLFNSKNDSV